jgi:hypothetical protein
MILMVSGVGEKKKNGHITQLDVLHQVDFEDT